MMVIECSEVLMIQRMKELNDAHLLNIVYLGYLIDYYIWCIYLSMARRKFSLFLCFLKQKWIG